MIATDKNEKPFGITGVKWDEKEAGKLNISVVINPIHPYWPPRGIMDEHYKSKANKEKP